MANINRVQSHRRRDTTHWPNRHTFDMHSWSHIHGPLHAAKAAANQHLEQTGGKWTESTAARFLTKALTILPPGMTVAELNKVDCRWLAIIWNKSAGLADQLDQITRSA